MRANCGCRALGTILTLALLFAGCATDKAFREKEARAFRDRGERYLANDQSSQALEQFLQALEIYPEDPYLHYDLALTYDMKGMLAKTQHHLKQAIRLKSDYSDAYNYLGFVYFREGKVDEAIRSYHRALSNELYLNPQDAHLNLGVAHLSLKEYQKAIQHLEEAIRLVPDFTAAYNTLGQAYEGLGQYDRARLMYERAIEFNPRYADAYLNLGKLLYRSGEREEAKKNFIQVIRSAPTSEKALEAKGYLRKLK